MDAGPQDVRGGVHDAVLAASGVPENRGGDVLRIDSIGASSGAMDRQDAAFRVTS